MANQSKSTSRSIFLDTTSAQSAVDNLAKKVVKLDKTLEDTNLSQKKRDELSKQRADAEIKRMNIVDQINKGLGATYNQQQRYLNDLNREIKNIAVGTEEWKKKAMELQNANKVFGEMKTKLNGIEDAHQKAGGKVNSFFASFAGAAAAMVSLDGIKSIITGSIHEFLEADRVSKDLKNSLANLGRTDALAPLSKQAEELASKFKYLDNDDILAAQDKLVTYGKLSIAEIQKLTPVILDYAAKTGKELPDAAEDFIKALEGQGKSMKAFGIKVNETNGVTKNLGILTTDLAAKVKGASDTFGESAEGGIKSLQQGLKDIQEGIGTFIAHMVEGADSADKVFDNAKTQTEAYEQSLPPLLSRYDELKDKTSLNASEQEELRGVISKIAELVPSAVTEFNSYGQAIDINKDKVASFLETNKEFLRQKESSAIKDITGDLKNNLDKISDYTNSYRNLTQMQAKGYQGLDDQIAKILAAIRKRQGEVLENADKLSSKYGVQLPADLAKAVTAIQGELNALNKVNDVAATAAESEAEKLAKKKRDDDAKKVADDAAKKAKEEADRKKAALEAAKKDIEKLRDDIAKDINKGTNDEMTAKFNEIDKLATDRIKEAKEKAIKSGMSKAELQALIDQIIAARDAAIEGMVKASGSKAAALPIYLELYESQAGIIGTRIIDTAKDKILNPEAKKALEDSLAKATEQLGTSTAKFSIEALQLQIMKSSGKAKLEAQKAQLELEKAQEIETKKATGAEKEIIEQQYRDKQSKLEADFRKEQFAKISEGLNYLSQAIDIVGKFNDARNAKENAQFDKEKKQNDIRRSDIKKLADKKVITETEATKRLAALDAEEDKKKEALEKKQAERNKRMAIAQAIVNGALAVTKILAETPKADFGIATAIQIGLAIATTAAQVATIASQKFAGGGKVLPDGKISAKQNIPTQSNGDNVLATVRTGEVILNERQQRMLGGERTFAAIGVPGFAGGGRVLPAYLTRPYQAINYGYVQRSLVRGYADGGLVTNQPIGTSAATSTTQATNTDAMQMLQQSQQINTMLLQTLQSIQRNGIEANVSLNKIQKAQLLQDSIRKDGQFV
jgi:hypothetical protein